MTTIDLTEPAFPNNAILIMHTIFEGIDDRFTILSRPARVADPNFTIAIYSTNWRPTPNSEEFRGIEGPREATLERFTLRVAGFVKNTDEEEGLIQHSVISEVIRSMLYDDPTLRAELGGLTATVMGVTKRLKRWWPVSTAYISNDLKGNQLFLSTTELILEVEKV